MPASRSPVLTFVALVFAFSVVFYALMIISGHIRGGDGMYVRGIMWCPAFAALLTCRIHRIPLRTLGWGWGGHRLQAAAWWLPATYALVAYGFVWSTGLGKFPSPEFVQHSVTAVGLPGVPAWATAALMIALYAVYGFLGSCVNALGEEIGWRGFLAPRLTATHGFAAASIITGCIWALWHYPAILFSDYNIGSPAWVAIPCFTVMIIGSSFVFTWFRLRSNSLWTATFLHASHNLFIQAIFTPLTADTGHTKYAIDEFGFVLPIVIGVVAFWCWRHRDAALAAWHRDT